MWEQKRHCNKVNSWHLKEEWPYNVSSKLGYFWEWKTVLLLTILEQEAMVETVQGKLDTEIKRRCLCLFNSLDTA